MKLDAEEENETKQVEHTTIATGTVKLWMTMLQCWQC